MDGFRPIWITFFALALFTACVKEENKTSCGEGERLNTSLRTCETLVVVPNNNFPPVGIDQAISGTEDVNLNFTLTSANDSNGDTLSYEIVSHPLKGTLSNCMDLPGSTGPTDRTCLYDPTLDEYGADEFYYKVYDGYVYGTLNVKVDITLATVNNGPNLVDQNNLSTNESTPYTYTVSYTDREGDVATFCSTSNLLNLTAGVCSCNAFGVCTVSLTPTTGLNSPLSTFSFDISVTAGGTTTLTETIQVVSVNDPPVLTDAVCVTSLNQDAPLICTLPSATDTDISDTQDWSITSGTGYCNWINFDTITGAISGTPTDEDVGTCTLQYSVSDGDASVTSTPITITVLNLAPSFDVSDNTIKTINEDTTSQLVATFSSDSTCVAAPSVICLRNDRIENGTLSYSLDNTVSTCLANGTISQTDVDSDPVTFHFTPNSHYVGYCNISFTFNDGNTSNNTVNFVGSIRVLEINDKPTISSFDDDDPHKIQTTNEGTLMVVDIDTNDVDIDPIVLDEGGGTDENGQTLTIKVTSSNTTLLPHTSTNIRMYSDADFETSYAFQSANSSGVTYKKTTDSNNQSLYLVLTPVAGRTGSSTITIVVTDNGTTNGAPDPKTADTRTFTFTVDNNAVAHGDWTKIYAVGAKIQYDGTIAAGDEPEVQLAWNAFTPFNDTIAGYHVFRSTHSDGPFLNKVSTDMISAEDRTFTDETLTADDAGETYYYRVMAVSTDNEKLIDSSSTYSTLRIPIPPHNMALVHRRMANMEVCSTMDEDTDKFNHHRCAYVGPGDGGTGYYDIGKDHFVDRYEASCNYTVNNFDCTEIPNGKGCIGAGIPVTGIPATGEIKVTTTAPAIYYNRTNGACYYYSGSWKQISSLTPTELTNFAFLNQKTQETEPQDMKATFPKRPPIVRIHQYRAYNYCTSGLINPSFETTSKKLMTRQVHIAASAWSSTTDEPETLEEGATLSSSISQCNSSSGADLEFQSVLLNSLIDTWTGTASTSTPRFVMAGSDATESCQSVYGIQDLIGNVEEWNTDRFYAHHVANRMFYPVGDYGNDYSAFSLDSSYNPYTYDSGTIYVLESTAVFSDYTLESGTALLTHIFPTMGLPSWDATFGYALSITSLNADYAYVSSFSTSTANGVLEDQELFGLTSGGNFTNESGSGRYTLRFRTACHDTDDDGECEVGEITANGTEENVYTGFRCMLEIPNPDP